MKSTKIVTNVSGQEEIIVEIKKEKNEDDDEVIEIFIDGNLVALKKIKPKCVFCGNTEKVFKFDGKIICNKCIDEILKKFTKPLDIKEYYEKRVKD